MLTLLPLLAFAFLVAMFRRKRVQWRESLLFASIPWALFLAFITEALTQFRVLTRTGVAWSWLAFAVLCFAWMWRTTRVSESGANIEADDTPLPWFDRTVLVFITVILTLIAITALASAPNTWDAMMYHLPRVVEWMNNRGVQFFPTIDRFQLDQPPFAEYAMLHLYLLYRSDRLVALVQWAGYAGCILAASLIAKELGGSRHSQIVAAVFSAIIPTAVLEASGTKTEIVAAYWIALAVNLMLRWRNSPDWLHAFAIGSTLGLAVFTKGTSYVLLPCIILACGVIWDTTARKRFLFYIPVIAMMGVLVCAPLWVRNYQYTGSPLGLPYFDGAGGLQGRMLRATHITPATILANMARNASLHAGVPNDQINAFSTHFFSGFIHTIGVDPNDPGQLSATSFGYTPRFQVRFDPRYEVLTGDSLPLFLLLLAGFLFLIYRKKIGKETGWLGLGLLGAFILYSALLRWSPWNARYMLPIFVLGASLSAVVLVRTMPRWTVTVLVGLALVYALPLALMNQTRPLVTKHYLDGSILTMSRNETYFLDFHQGIAKTYIAAAAAARASDCRTIGLDANHLHFEYPMMALLEHGGIHRQIRYVGVENSSIRYAQPSAPKICMVICLQCLHDSEKIATYSIKLPKVQSFGTVAMLFSRPALEKR